MTAARHALPDYRLRIGKFLKDLRNSRGATMRQIADLSGYAVGAIERMESGHYAASYPILAAYKTILDANGTEKVTVPASMQRKLQRCRKAGLLPPTPAKGKT